MSDTLEPFLSEEDIKNSVSDKLKKYEGLNFLERYAMYMGVAQILELGLKNLLCEKYDYELESLERKTLGQTARELKKCELRPDFLSFLDSVVEYRNYIAHELLVNHALFQSLLSEAIEDHYSKEERRLDKAIYELEQISVLFDWSYKNDAW